MDVPNDAAYVAISEIAVAGEGADALEDAFRDRLGAVDRWPGFLGLEVLRHRRRAGSYLMISRWTSKDAFQDYMRSAVHKTSHDRIPSGPHAPRPAGFDDYDVVAT
jgi:heme-degrading monooxygenase HmoA